ncbi:MAG: CHASE2 domain-containing protein [Bacteroidota bacterium]|nr:CHASE2 domain-containing protein [Bacteroidota bacterium]
MKKWLGKFFHADVLFGTIFVFGLLIIVQNLFGNINFDVYDPIGQALDQFEVDDLVYTAFREEQKKDTNITMVNIGNLSRGEIGQLIMNLNQYKPKVIGIDARFIKDKTQYYIQNGLPDGDTILAQAFAETENLVLVTDMQRDTAGVLNGIVTSHPKFMQYAMPGFANMITDAKEFRVARKVHITEKYQDSTYLFFPVKIASVFNKAKADKFIARNKDLETIYYRGNINNFGGEVDPFGHKDVFNKIDVQEGMEGTFNPKYVTGKILVLGYMGESINNNLYWDEDKFYTPLNKNFAGKSFPDMYGVTVHANVVSMVLNETYIDEMPENYALYMNIIICLINVVIFSYIHHHIHLWWDGLSMLVGLLEVVVLYGIKIAITLNYRYSIDVTYSVVFIFVLGNFLELYYEYAKPGIVFVVQKVQGLVLSKKTKKYL